MMVKNTG